jgi:hypothetical protein
MTYHYEFSIEAATETEAVNKMKALTVLAKNLKEKELCKLANVIKNDPVKTALAKRYLGV